MNEKIPKKFKKSLCLFCIFSLCISSTAMAAAHIGDVYTFADGSLSLRATSDTTVSISGYDASKNSSGNLNIQTEYKLVGPDGNIHTDGYGNEILFHVTGIEDNVFRNIQTFQSIYIQSDAGIQIGNSAFEGIAAGGTLFNSSTVTIAGNLTGIGDSAFARANITGNFIIENINGSIGAGAFRNINLKGRLLIDGSIDTLEDYALSGMVVDGLAMPAVIRHMGDGVYKDTNLGSHNIIPLSNSLKSIGSKVFEGASLAGICLPEGDTVENAASDAFPDTEGMLIIIPESLTNLAVFHFDQYKNLIFQTAEGLSDNSSVIRYLEENGLTYKKGANGELIHPEPAESPTPEPTQIPPSKTPDATQAPPSKTPDVSQAPPSNSPATSQTPPSRTPDATQVPPSKTPDTTQAPPSKEPGATTIPEPAETQMPKPDETLTPEPNVTPTADPSQTEEPSQTNTPSPSNIPTESPVLPEETKNHTYSTGKLKVQLLNANKAMVTGPSKKNATSIVIPEIVTINGNLYQITKVEKRAFKGMKHLKKVKVGNRVRQIGDEAFAKCPKLKSIQLGTGLVSMGKKVLYQDRKIRKIIIKGTKLKKIGKKTFSGIPSKKVTIKVKRSKLKYYQKLIKKAR